MFFKNREVKMFKEMENCPVCSKLLYEDDDCNFHCFLHGTFAKKERKLELIKEDGRIKTNPKGGVK